ncbi:MAG: hypothetical protein R2909_17485 [Gemmatimonadales bacterium]
MSNGKPRPAFFGAVFLVVIALVALGLWRFGALDRVVGGGGDISPDDLAGAEAADARGSRRSRSTATSRRSGSRR